MQYVPFGSHGFSVSRLGMGMMRLPTREENGQKTIDREAAIALVRHGIDQGISYVDTAYGYHNGESEIVTGLALKNGYREKVTLTTKLPLWLVKEEKDMNRLLDEQLKKLDVPYVDFYILHAVNRDRLHQMQALHYQDFLRQALRDGRIRHTGFSFHDDQAAFLETLQDFDQWGMAQIQFNYLDDDRQATEEGLHAAGRMGVPIVVMEPLRGGALANPPDNVRALMEANQKQRSAVEWAFAYVANFPEVATILSGINTMEQMDDNLRIFNSLRPDSLTEEEKQLIRQLKQAYLSRMPVGCTGCEYCIPCPGGVSIPNVFRAYNESKMFNDHQRFLRAYENMEKESRDGGKCLSCGRCESLCPQHLPIAHWLQTIDREYREKP